MKNLTLNFKTFHRQFHGLIKFRTPFILKPRSISILVLATIIVMRAKIITGILGVTHVPEAKCGQYGHWYEPHVRQTVNFFSSIFSQKLQKKFPTNNIKKKIGEIDNGMTTTRLTGIHSFMYYDDLWYIPIKEFKLFQCHEWLNLRIREKTYIAQHIFEAIPRNSKAYVSKIYLQKLTWFVILKYFDEMLLRDVSYREPSDCCKLCTVSVGSGIQLSA